MSEALKVLLEHGLLGVVAVLAILFGWRMYRDRQKVEAKVDKLHQDHKNEMKALEERYITKAETWMQQYHDLAKTQLEVLDAIERRYGREDRSQWQDRR